MSSVILSAECSYYWCLCAGFSQSAVWWSQPGRLWLQPHPAVGATALLWQPAHERHAAGDNAQCGQRDWTPTEPSQTGGNHWPNRGDSLLLLLTLRYLTIKYFNLFLLWSAFKRKINTVWKYCIDSNSLTKWLTNQVRGKLGPKTERNVLLKSVKFVTKCYLKETKTK